MIYSSATDLMSHKKLIFLSNEISPPKYKQV